MISHLKGILAEKFLPSIVIDVQGVGYEVQVSAQTYSRLPEINANVQLYIQMIVREDAHSLYGFIDRSERTLFQQLIKITGIGSKMALAILSTFTADELSLAIHDQDVKKLSAIPGVGKKTAERLILELKGKLVQSNPNNMMFDYSSSHNTSNDIQQALVALGYSEREAQKVMVGLPENITVEEGIRLALQNTLGKK